MSAMKPRLIAVILAPALAVASCGGADEGQPEASDGVAATTAEPEVTTESEPPQASEPEVAPEPEVTTAVEGDGDASVDGDTVLLRADVWADNWFRLWINGELVGEDSVPITTERSFNAETFTFEAALPLTIAVEAKDFKENDTGLEYIGTDRQQMGDGGLILQIVDVDTGEAVAASGADWRALVTHIAPLDTSCERSDDPEADCASATVDAPTGWTDFGFDDSAWDAATIWSAGDVSPKDGYDEIAWDPSAELVWGGDLETDNTVLLRSVAG